MAEKPVDPRTQLARENCQIGKETLINMGSLDNSVAKMDCSKHEPPKTATMADLKRTNEALKVANKQIKAIDNRRAY